MKRLLISIIMVLGFISSAHAQLTPDVSLTATPSDPQPLQRVTITAESYGMNLDQSTIIWRYNNTIIDSGMGRKTVTVTAPAAGTSGTISMTASNSSGSASSSIVLRPASIDLLWEATDSYTPPFYKGKALASVNSLLRITAVPSSAAPKQLVYTWSGNDSVLGSLSGYGKSSLTFRNSALDNSEKISVTGQGGSFSGTSTIIITPGTPSMVVYEKDEGFIDYANGYSTALATAKSGLILRIEPFFFSVPLSIANNLAFAVSEREVDITNPTVSNELYLSSPGSSTNSLFTIVINTVSYSLQNLTRNFVINFL